MEPVHIDICLMYAKIMCTLIGQMTQMAFDLTIRLTIQWKSGSAYYYYAHISG